MNLKANKKALPIILVSTLVFSVLLLTVFAKSKPDDETMVLRQREYIAQKGDITVGIDGVGKILLNSQSLTLPQGVSIKEVYVKAGQQVAKGDKLLTLDHEQTKQTLAQAQQKKDSAQASLDAATAAKSAFEAQLAAKIANLQKESLKLYQEAANPILNSISSIQATIEQLQEQIANLKQQIEDLKNQPLNDEALESGNILHKDELLQPSNSNNTQEIEKLEAEIAKLETEIQALHSQLTTAQNQLTELENKRQSDLTEENATISLLQKESQPQLITLQNTINLAKVEVDEKNKEIQQINKLLATTALYAPKDGVVLSVGVKTGDLVTAEPVITFGDFNQRELILPIESANINEVEIGQKVEFFTEAFPSQAFTGVVTQKKLIPTSEGKYEVTVAIDQTDASLQHGMLASATLIVKQKKDILTLSNKAVILKDGKQYVTKKSTDGVLQQVEIVTGFSNGRTSEIISGLTEGDVVIVEG